MTLIIKTPIVCICETITVDINFQLMEPKQFEMLSKLQ